MIEITLSKSDGRLRLSTFQESSGANWIDLGPYDAEVVAMLRHVADQQLAREDGEYASWRANFQAIRDICESVGRGKTAEEVIDRIDGIAIAQLDGGAS
mgnify:CR=1 FL=1